MVSFLSRYLTVLWLPFLRRLCAPLWLRVWGWMFIIGFSLALFISLCLDQDLIRIWDSQRRFCAGWVTATNLFQMLLQLEQMLVDGLTGRLFNRRSFIFDFSHGYAAKVVKRRLRLRLWSCPISTRILDLLTTKSRWLWRLIDSVNKRIQDRLWSCRLRVIVSRALV